MDGPTGEDGSSPETASACAFGRKYPVGCSGGVAEVGEKS